jgi:hypothetical protein
MNILKGKNSGATLLELIVTIVVAVLAAGLIFSGYIIVLRIWHNHSHRIEASGGAWVTYLKVERQISGSYYLRKATRNKWVLYKDRTDSCELTYDNRSLFSSDSFLRNHADIDTFHLDLVDTSGIFPVWECGFVYSQGLMSSGMSWRTVCRGKYIDPELPAPLKAPPVQADLYWENKGK